MYRIYFSQCQRVGGGGVWSRYKQTEPGGPGPDYVAYTFVFLETIIICRLYTLTISDQV